MRHSSVNGSRYYIRGSLLSTKELKVDVKTVRDPAHALIDSVLNGLGAMVEETDMDGRMRPPLSFILRLLEEKLIYYPLL